MVAWFTIAKLLTEVIDCMLLVFWFTILSQHGTHRVSLYCHVEYQWSLKCRGNQNLGGLISNLWFYQMPVDSCHSTAQYNFSSRVWTMVCMLMLNWQWNEQYNVCGRNCGQCQEGHCPNRCRNLDLQGNPSAFRSKAAVKRASRYWINRILDPREGC